ncbi:C3H1 type-like 1, partial [Durusdinium trenchii]
ERGKCNRGSACSFAHGVEHLKQKPDLTRTKLCILYHHGQCPAGEDCHFAHAQGDLQKCRPKRVVKPGLVRHSHPHESLLEDEDTPRCAQSSSSNVPTLQLPEELCSESPTENCPDLEDEQLTASVKNTFLHFERATGKLPRSNSWPAVWETE